MTPFAGRRNDTEGSGANGVAAQLAALRKELSTQTAPPIQQVLDLGGLPTLLGLINNQSSAIQLEAYSKPFGAPVGFPPSSHLPFLTVSFLGPCLNPPELRTLDLAYLEGLASANQASDVNKCVHRIQ